MDLKLYLNGKYETLVITTVETTHFTEIMTLVVLKSFLRVYISLSYI